MIIDASDILILFCLAILVSLIIGMNVMNVVDKKISDISINVPGPKCPQPNIVIMTETGEVKEVKLTSNDTELEKLEGFKVLKNNLIDVSDDNGIKSTIIATDTNQPRLFLRQGYHSTPSERNMVNRDQNIMNPDHNDILRYNGPGCYQNIDTRKIRKVQLVNKPSLQRCSGNLHTAAVNTIRTKTIAANGDIVDQHVNFYIPQTYLSTVGRRNGIPTGYPAMDIIARDSGEPSDIDQIGSIPVNNYKGEPVPIGSILMS
jgi:hypothetical protein